jgi:hypothetical protein
MKCSKCKTPSKSVYCKRCNSFLTIQRQRRFKKACLMYRGEHCENCGGEFNQAAMCFRKREKGVKISTYTGCEELAKHVRAELDTRQVLCMNCERKIYRSKSPSGLKKACVAHMGGECSLCGYSECFSALEFHHENPTGKSFAVGDRSEKSFERCLPELEKCVMVCANCHATLHAKETDKKYADLTP